MATDAGKAACILVVEDEALVRMVAVDGLQECGFAVEEAATAAEALDKLRSADLRIQAAIVDLGLPDQRGHWLLAEVRSMRPNLPVVVASGYSGGEPQTRFGADPLVRFVPKPYTDQALIEALRELGVPPPHEAGR